jgi:predicted N-acyltransferase
LRQLASETDASSAHVTFLPEEEWRELGLTPWLRRTDTQFHWYNHGYDTFDAFLSDLSSRKRKNIRKERQTISELGIQFDQLTGRAITEAHWDAFFAFYMETGSRKWGSPYLTRRFFSLIGETMAERILLIIARRGRKAIAGALNFIGSDALYGRNWGAIEHHPNLHFEACYYQAIDFAIAQKLARVEAGAQGPHKLARGYMPKSTHSLHYLAHPGLARAVADYLDHERRAVADDQSALAEHAPFRNAGEDDF